MSVVKRVRVNKVLRDCPIQNCGAKDLVRLDNHLRQLHKLNYTQRRKWLQETKIQPKVMNNKDECSEEHQNPTVNRVLRDCPIPNCGAKHLARLDNHLRQVHKLNYPQRRKWLQETKLRPKVKVTNYKGECGEARPSPNRVLRDCPLPICGAKYLVRLDNHLRQVHKLNCVQRRKWLQETKIQPKVNRMDYQDKRGETPLSRPRTVNKEMRVYHKCPIHHCTANHIFNLSTHLRVVHKLDRIERRKWLKEAKQTPKLAVIFYNHEPQVDEFDEELELCPTCASEARVSRPPPVHKSHRVCRDCPIPNCGAKYLVRLPKHLNDVHKLDAIQRKKWLEQAKLQPSAKMLSLNPF